MPRVDWDGNKLPENCPTCGKLLELKVIHGKEGYYLGAWCCEGPYPKETCYFPTRIQATAVFSSIVN